MILVYRYSTDAEARAAGAHGGDMVLTDGNFVRVPGERVYRSYEREAAESRAEELSEAERLQGVPDLFADLFSGGGDS